MGTLLKAVPELANAGLLLALWIDPRAFGVEWFRSGVLALLLEFFVIHAGGFMAVLMYDPGTPAGKRALQVGGLAVFYLLFVSLVAWSMDAWWMTAAFAWLCFGKLQAIWTGAPPTERDRTHAIVSWALAVAVFLGAVFLTVMIDVPVLGAGAAMRDAAGFDPKGGVWEAEPHRALAGAVLYFAVMGISRPILARAFAAREAAATG